MKTSLAPLTVEQTARRLALTGECVECGESTVILVDRGGCALDHRCGRGAVGPVWTLLAPPASPARLAVVAGVLAGVVTREQAAAAPARPLTVNEARELGGQPPLGTPEPADLVDGLRTVAAAGERGATALEVLRAAAAGADGAAA